jgi:SAM-dependent methyltransferase
VEAGAILRILRTEEDNRRARAELDRRGLSMLRRGWAGRLGLRFGIERLAIGDLRKSWDVLATATFLEDRLEKDAPIVDFGAHRSEITGVLCRMGYENLHAMDLNPRLVRGPYPGRIHYRVGDFLATDYAAGTFAAITSISAIEHGRDLDRLFTEVARLLRPGGFFVGSTDYWPEKIDTSGIELFGMDWTVFSAAELASLFESARGHGLVPAGALDYAAGDQIAEFAGRRYTFAWFAFQKDGGPI